MSTIYSRYSEALAAYTDFAILLTKEGCDPRAETELMVQSVLKVMPDDTEVARMLRIHAECRFREMWAQACTNARVLTK